MAPRTPDILDCASAQWIGKRREQEDVVKSLPAAGGMLGIVCDGMGGHLRGDCASCVVAQGICCGICGKRHRGYPGTFNGGFACCQQGVGRHSEGTGGIRNHIAGRLHPRPFPVVDQRGRLPLYLWSGADSFRMDRLNEDHSMRPIADCLYRKGKMSLQGALRQRCILRSAVMGGPMELVDISAMPLLLHPGDAVLACSDGLQVWSELLREPSFLALQKARDCSSRELVGIIMEQVKDMLEPQQDNASVWAAVMRKPCEGGK